MLIADERFELTPAGELLIDLTPELGLTYRIGPWAAALPTARRIDKRWHHDPPTEEFLPLLNIESSRPGDTSALARFLGEIPAAFRSQIAPFQHRQLAMLRLLNQLPEAAQLAASAPALLWLLVDHQQRHRIAPQRMRALLRQKRHRLASLVLDVPGEDAKSALRVLTKVVLQQWADQHVQARLRAFFASGRWRRFRHGLVPTLAWLRQEDIPEWMSERLLLDASGLEPARLGGHLRQLRAIAADALELANALNLPDPMLVLSRCRTAAELTRLHDRWTERLNQAELARAQEIIDLPPPPVPGNQRIVPIRSALGLHLEGRHMRHCVAAYSRRVQAGECYIYQVLAPERATLELSRNGDKWTIAQLKLAFNGTPAEATWREVSAWLSDPQNPDPPPPPDART